MQLVVLAPQLTQNQCPPCGGLVRCPPTHSRAQQAGTGSPSPGPSSPGAACHGVGRHLHLPATVSLCSWKAFSPSSRPRQIQFFSPWEPLRKSHSTCTDRQSRLRVPRVLLHRGHPGEARPKHFQSTGSWPSLDPRPLPCGTAALGSAI